MKEFDATVVSVTEKGVLLDQTAFYPLGGGQQNDTGVLAVDGVDHKVVDVRKEGDDIYHKIEPVADIKPGSRVRGRIDWDRRYSLMRYHTFLHVLDAIVHNKHNGNITGGIIYHDRCHMDFDMSINREIGEKLIEEANLECEKGYGIKAYFISPAEAEKIPNLARTLPGSSLIKTLDSIRIVEIEGMDLQADGGTHVANTKEIGRMKLDGFKNMGAHRKRLEIKLVE